jgi:hypothetical protein
MAKLAVVIDDTPPPLSGARAELRRATEQLAAASHALAEAQGPERRLSAVVAELEAVELELAGLRAEDDKQLGAWLANGDVSAIRPSPSAATLAAETKLIALQRDAGAAKAALPVATDRVQRATEAVGRLNSVRLRAVWECAVAEAARYADEVWRPMLTEGLRVSAPLHSLRDELTKIGRSGVDPDPAVIGAAMRVDEIIRETRATTGAPPDPAAGCRLLAALIDDATAELGTPRP